jgi:hypothetical protein
MGWEAKGAIRKRELSLAFREQLAYKPAVNNSHADAG